MTDRLPPAPPGLSPEARKLWRLYNTGWLLDENGQTVLRLALEAHDRMREAQRQIRRQGYRPSAKGAPSPFNVERDCRRDVSKLLRSLGLSLEPAKDRPR